jgi:hypothetical protein
MSSEDAALSEVASVLQALIPGNQKLASLNHRLVRFFGLLFQDSAGQWIMETSCKAKQAKDGTGTPASIIDPPFNHPPPEYVEKGAKTSADE